MPKIVQYNLPPGGTVVQLADNLTTALEIEGADSKDYVVVKTTDGSESVEIKAGGAGVQINESGQMKSTATGGWFLISAYHAKLFRSQYGNRALRRNDR